MALPYELLIGLRYTRAKRRNHFISFISLISMLGMAGGLAAGLLAARLRAGRLAARGELSPRVLRRARPDETCATV